MSGVAVTADRVAARAASPRPYLDETLAFIVPDHLPAAFSEWSTRARDGTPSAGVPRAPYFVQKIREELTDVDIVPIDRMDDMFTPHDPPIDALVADRRTRLRVHAAPPAAIRWPCRSRAR